MLKTRVSIYCDKSLQYSNLIVKIIHCAVKLKYQYMIKLNLLILLIGRYIIFS